MVKNQKIKIKKSSSSLEIGNWKLEIPALRAGQSLVELLLAIGLLAILLPALITGVISSREGNPQQKQRISAVSLLQETQEAVRSTREKGWNIFAVNGTYHPIIQADYSWGLASGSTTTTDGFTQTIEISDVFRDSNGNISSSGTLDPSTKKVTITISWLIPLPSSIVSTTYLARFDNLTYIDTTQADFNAGVTTNTSVTNTSGGEVILGAGGGGGDWCQPSKSITEQDLPKSGVANAISAIEGQVFAGTGDNSSGVSFANVPLTLVDPPTASVAATFDGYKTNAVFGEANYAYLGTDKNSEEFVIIDLTQYSDSPANTKYKKAGYINITAGNGNFNGNSIYVINDKAYVLANSNFFIYDITTRSGAHTTALNGNGLALSGNGKKIIIIENYAYIATDATSNQFQIVDVSNPASPTIAGQITLGSSQSGVDIFENKTGTRAYFVTAYSSGQSNFFIIDTTSKSNPQIIGPGYNTDGMSPKGVTVVTGNRAIVVGTGGSEQYQVFSISNESSPSKCAGVAYSTGVNGVASVLQSNGYAYSYIITGDANAELKIILGGAGGQYSAAGTFVSRILDAGYQTAFNRFSATFNQPSQTTIGFQVAVANPSDGNCTTASYTYIGPNLTSSTTDLFTQNSSIPIFSSGSYQNPGRCFRYKVYFTSSDPTQTPELEDFTVNYSP